MSQLPAGTLGDAVGVLIYTFICFFANLTLIWLLWVHQERLGYVALIAYFALLCTTSSISQQIYNYTYWTDLLWEQLYYTKKYYPNADVIFNNGNFGFMLVLANIRLFCYIIESTYLFVFSVQILMSVHGGLATRRRSERLYNVPGKIVPIILSGISVGLLQTPAVQSSFTVYMVVANVQSCTACALSIVLIAIIIWRYTDSRRLWTFIRTSPNKTGQRDMSWKPWQWSWSRRSGQSEQSAQTPPQRAVPKRMHDNSWLVMRLSIAILLISAFILASIITHIPQREDVARDAKANAPDLSASRASSNIIGYIFGVTPGLAITIVFGLTKPFRQTMSETFGPRRWWGKRHGSTRVPAAQAGPSQVELLPFAEEPRMISGQTSTTSALTVLPVTATGLPTRDSEYRADPVFGRGGPTGIKAGNHMHSDSSDSNKSTAPLL